MFRKKIHSDNIIEQAEIIKTLISEFTDLCNFDIIDKMCELEDSITIEYGGFLDFHNKNKICDIESMMTSIIKTYMSFDSISEYINQIYDNKKIDPTHDLKYNVKDKMLGELKQQLINYENKKIELIIIKEIQINIKKKRI